MKDLEPYHPLPFLQLCSVVTRHLVIEESCLLTTGEGGEDRTQMTHWNNLHADRERHWSGIGCLLLCTLLCTHIQSHGLLAYIPTIYIVRLYIQEVWLQQLHTNTGHNEWLFAKTGHSHLTTTGSCEFPVWFVALQIQCTPDLRAHH